METQKLKVRKFLKVKIIREKKVSQTNKILKYHRCMEEEA